MIIPAVLFTLQSPTTLPILDCMLVNMDRQHSVISIVLVHYIML